MKQLFLAMNCMLILSCNSRINPNEHVVYTTDNWNSMRSLKSGDPIPRLLSPYDRIIILPAAMLSGESSIDTKFENRVAATLQINYNYLIQNPTLFVTTTKSVISCPTSDAHKIQAEALEEIENNMIDKIASDVVREYTPLKSTDISENEVENDLLKLLNQKFKERGLSIEGMSVNVVFSEQVEEALDAASAIRIYKAIGEEQLGKEIIKAKAGATIINIQK